VRKAFDREVRLRDAAKGAQEIQVPWRALRIFFARLAAKGFDRSIPFLEKKLDTGEGRYKVAPGHRARMRSASGGFMHFRVVLYVVGN
jgi:hypothetical protein